MSVVVPCYNYGRYLGACVDSVLTQQDVQAEVVIVDDASPDGSGEVAEQLAQAHPRVRVIRHETNKGHIATYNDGLREVDGDFVVLLSADDLLTPGALSRAVALFDAFPRVGLVYGHPRNVDDAEVATAVAVTAVRSWSVWDGHEWIAGRCRRGRNPLYSPEVVLRGSIHRQIGEYDPALPHTADLDMWMRAASISDVARVDGPDQAWRRLHGTNMSQTRFAGELRDFRERALAFDAFFAGWGDRLPDAAALHRTARTSLARAVLEHACELARAPEPDLARIDEALGLAQELAPGVRSLLPWRELAWRRAGHPQRAADRVVDVALAARRDLRYRVDWHQWRWGGL